MLTQVHRILTALFFLIAFFDGVLGCDSNDESPFELDTVPPATPRGVKSITGDGQVTIEWFLSDERDLAGYKVWRGTDNENFELLEEVASNTSQFVDRDLNNGITYYYAVSSIDLDGNESDLSPEEVFDTPRPSGNNVTLNDFNLFPDRSGFDLSQPSRGAIAWDLPTVDVYFGFVPDAFTFAQKASAHYLYSDNDTEMQDMGYHENFDEIDESPLPGFVPGFIELFEGHVYVLRTPDGNFAKIHINAVSENLVAFDWAYQIDPDNPELAPPLINTKGENQ